MSASDMNPREALVGSLRRLGAGDSEPPGKMAYLSLTSKNEGPLRDAVAWQLHRTLAGASGIGVAKEWKRFDIAVLENGMPVALVEAKAGYAAEMIDAERPNTDLRDAVRKDIDKLRNNCWAATAGCWRFVLVFLTYNHQVPVAPDGVLRSYGRRRRLVKGAEPTVRRSDLECAPYYGDEEIRQGFSCYLVAWGDLPVVASGQVPAGKAFGTRVSVYYWLLEVAD